jgi:hypothetical protein
VVHLYKYFIAAHSVTDSVAPFLHHSEFSADLPVEIPETTPQLTRAESGGQLRLGELLPLLGLIGLNCPLLSSTHQQVLKTLRSYIL